MPSNHYQILNTLFNKKSDWDCKGGDLNTWGVN
jgi:hypothetical protein